MFTVNYFSSINYKKYINLNDLNVIGNKTKVINYRKGEVSS